MADLEVRTGTVSIGVTGTVFVPFPVPFKNAGLQGFVLAVLAGSISVVSVSATGITLSSGLGSSNAAQWAAIGF